MLANVGGRLQFQARRFGLPALCSSHAATRFPVVTRPLQILLLVLILAAGAWLYLFQYDGMTGVTALLSGTPATPVPAPAPAPPRASPAPADRPRPAAAATADAALPAAPATGYAVPAHSVAGEVAGLRFVLDSARIESGVLHLRQARPALELELVLPGNPWQIPSGRSFEVLAPARRGADTPLVRVRPSSEAADVYAQRYTLWLEFGAERAGKLPGRLHLSLPDADGSRVAGTFVADIRGFRFVNGRPDLSADSVETLEYLALREILRADPQRALADLAFRSGELVPAHDSTPASGYLEADYRTDGVSVRRAFRFVKEDGSWRVREQDSAHAAPRGR